MSRSIGKWVLLSCALVAAYFVSVAHAQTKAFLTSSVNNNLTVIDADARTIQARVSMGTPGFDVAVNPTGTRAYVANAHYQSNDQGISVVDTASNALVGKISMIAPNAVEVTRDGRRVYAISARPEIAGQYLVEIDAATNATLRSLFLSGGAGGDMAISRDGTRIYVAMFVGGVRVVDALSLSVITTIETPRGPVGISLSADGSRAFVANQLENTISVIDTLTNTIIRAIAAPSRPQQIAVNRAGTRLYVTQNTNDNRSLSIIDPDAGTVLKTLYVSPGGGWGINLDKDERFAYVVCNAIPGMALIDLATETVSGYVSLGAGAYSMTRGDFVFTRDSGPAAKVENIEEEIVEAMDASSISSAVARMLLDSLTPIQDKLAWIAANPSSPDLARIKRETCSLINQFNTQMDHYVRLRRLPARLRDEWKADMLEVKADLGCGN